MLFALIEELLSRAGSRADAAGLGSAGRTTAGCRHFARELRLAQERGWNAADTKAALDGWVKRMGQSMAVGQQFRKLLGY
jgi:hypothetical protein